MTFTQRGLSYLIGLLQAFKRRSDKGEEECRGGNRHVEEKRDEGGRKGRMALLYLTLTILEKDISARLVPSFSIYVEKSGSI